MPEAEISEEQLRRILDWIYGDENTEFISNPFPGMESGTWKVNGEPIIIYSRTESLGPAKHFVLCSDNHAGRLRELGIVDFTEVPQ